MDERNEIAVNVLLVDDEQEFLMPLARRLSRRGFLVRQAGGGREALAMLAEEPAEVAVVDMTMPDLDGLATLELMKKAHPDLEVILLSGRACLDQAINGMSKGAFDFLLKPADFETLVYKLTDAAAARRLRKGPAGENEP